MPWRPIVIGAGCLLVALGLALVLGRAWLRSDRGRERVGALAAQALSRAAGLEIEIAELALADAGRVRVGPIVVRDPRTEPSDPPLLTVRSLTFTVDWLGLAAGRVRIPWLAIDTPIVHVPRTRDGALRWPALGADEPRVPSGPRRFPALIALDEVTLRAGRLTLAAAPGGRAVTIDSLAFDTEALHDFRAGESLITLHALRAAWREGDVALESASGRLTLGAHPSLTTAPWQLALGSAPITFRLTADAGRARIALDAEEVPAGSLATLHPALAGYPAFGLHLTAEGPTDLQGPIALTLALETRGGRAELRGAITDLEPAPAGRFDLVVRDVDPHHFHPEAPAGRVGLRGQFAGTWHAGAPPAAEFELELMRGSQLLGRPLRGRVAGRTDAGALALAPVTLGYAGTELRGEGNRAPDGRLGARFTLSAPTLGELSALLGMKLGGDLSATGRAAGPPSALTASADIRSQALTIADGTTLSGLRAQLGLQGGARALLVAGADSAHLPGGAALRALRLTATATPRGSEQDLALQLEATDVTWEAAGIAPSPLVLSGRGRRRAEGAIQATIDTLTLGEVLSLAAPLALEQRPDALRVRGLDLRLAGGSIQGEGTLGRGARHLALTIEDIDLGALAMLLGRGRSPAIADSSRADSLLAAGPIASPVDSTFASATDSTFASATDSTRASATESPRPSATDSILASAADSARASFADAIVVPPIAGTLSAELELADEGRGPVGTIALDARAVELRAWPTPPIELELRSQVTESRISGTVHAQALADSFAVRGQVPVHLTAGKPAIAWDDSTLAIEVTAGGDSLAKYLGPFLLRMRGQGFMNHRLRTRLETTGVTFSARAAGRPRDPRTELQLDLDLEPLEPLGPGVFTLKATRPADTLAVVLTLDVEGMAAPLAIAGRTLAVVDLEQRQAAIPPSAPLSGQVSLSEFDLRLLDSFQQGDFEGYLNVAAEIAGTRSAPLVEGTLDLRGGKVELERYNLELDSLAVAAEFSEKRLVLRSASGRTAKGRIAAQGALPLTGDPAAGVELQAQITGLEFRTPEAMSFEGDTELVLSGTLAEPTLKGTLLVREGSIPIRERRQKEIIKIPADDPWLTGSAVAGRESAIETKLPVALDVTVDIPRNLWLRNRDVNVEIGGDLQLASPDGFLRVTGDLETRQGSVRLLNRRFSVQRGTVTFYGERTLKPMIDLRAETELQSTTIQIHLSGPIDEPKLEFTSEPAYSEGDIVSLLLFGRTASELTSGESTFVQDQVGAMASSYVSARLEQQVGQKLGLDVLEIETTSGHERVAVGKYVSSRTLLRAYQEMGTETYGGVAVEHALTKEFDLEASADDRGESGIDLMWKRGY